MAVKSSQTKEVPSRVLNSPRKKSEKKSMVLLALLFLMSGANAGSGQVNLDDIKIEGELQKEGLSIHSRDRFEIEKNIELRNSFRDLVLEYLPEGYERKPADIRPEK